MPSLRAQGLSFAYSSAAQVLENVHFHLTDGLDEDIVDFGFGIDTVGALQNTLRVIRLLLLRSKLPLMRELTKTTDIGFPMAAPTGYGIRFQRRLERYMENEERKRGREAQREARKKPKKKNT